MKRFDIINKFQTGKIKRVTAENYRVKTLEMDGSLPKAMPGQFILVWIPELGERPMSIGNSSPLTMSVANVGKFSAAITAMKTGDMFSYRGPFGRPFSIPEGAKRILVIGGGYGVVPMHFLAKTANDAGVEVIAVTGGRTDKDVIYEKQLASVCKEVKVTTDDGTKGRKGNVMVEVNDLLAKKKFDCVYTCGPEKMMYAIAQACRQQKVPCQVSLERYMKCGTGVCGSCAINGKLACKNGPVFTGEEAFALSDFGKVHRDATGQAHNI